MRFTLTVTSRADYDSDEYFTAERSFNTDHLFDALEHVEAFLKSAGFEFSYLEAVVDEEAVSDDIRDAETYNTTYFNPK
jgi:enamine deaminase RidA (YjgF/YER057c/UK114 family)